MQKARNHEDSKKVLNEPKICAKYALSYKCPDACLNSLLIDGRRDGNLHTSIQLPLDIYTCMRKNVWLRLPSGHGADVSRCMAGGAQALQRLGLVPLGETFSLGIGQQFVVVIGGCLVPQQRLKETMYVAGLEQVLAAGYQGDALKVIINGHSQMVAGWRIFSG